MTRSARLLFICFDNLLEGDGELCLEAVGVEACTIEGHAVTVIILYAGRDEFIEGVD